MNNRNRELKTISQMITSETSRVNIGGQVPAGMKRWVTFLMIDTPTMSLVSNCILYLASANVSIPIKASVIATSSRKLLLAIKGTQLSISNKKHPVMMPPSGPDPDKPLFSIAGGKWLGVWASQTTANVFMQYFDE